MCEKKTEAISRMRKLKLSHDCIEAFEKGKLWYSDRTRLGMNVFGALFDVPQEWKNKIKQFEKEHNALVYHATHEHTEFGDLLNLLYVSDHPEEWAYDNADMKHHIVMTYTINLTTPEYSEFGSIGVKMREGGLVRV